MACYLLTYRSLRRPGVFLCHAVPRFDEAPRVNRIETKLPEHGRCFVEKGR